MIMILYCRHWYIFSINLVKVREVWLKKKNTPIILTRREYLFDQINMGVCSVIYFWCVNLQSVWSTLSVSFYFPCQFGLKTNFLNLTKFLERKKFINMSKYQINVASITKYIVHIIWYYRYWYFT